MSKEKAIKAEVAEEKAESEAQAKFRLIIEAYQKQNPAKYEQKKEALLAKLNTL